MSDATIQKPQKQLTLGAYSRRAFLSVLACDDLAYPSIIANMEQRMCGKQSKLWRR
jgi:hypothetical protein